MLYFLPLTGAASAVCSTVLMFFTSHTSLDSVLILFQNPQVLHDPMLSTRESHSAKHYLRRFYSFATVFGSCSGRGWLILNIHCSLAPLVKTGPQSRREKEGQPGFQLTGVALGSDSVWENQADRWQRVFTDSHAWCLFS